MSVALPWLHCAFRILTVALRFVASHCTWAAVTWVRSSSGREAWERSTTVVLVIGGGGTREGAWLDQGGVDLRSDCLSDGTGEEMGGEWGVGFLEGIFLEHSGESIILAHAVLAGGLL